MILDYINNLSLPDDPRYGNELSVLRHLATGLRFLNAQVASIEKRKKEKVGEKVRVFSFGNDPVLPRAIQDFIVCAFHWYAISACNYAQLVGWLALPSRTDQKEYVKAVMLPVKTYRDKVAAHFARADPRKEDNAATLDASVLPSVAFDDDAFYVGAWRITKTVAGVPSSSIDFRWSLTKTHVELTKRYWPPTVGGQ